MSTERRYADTRWHDLAKRMSFEYRVWDFGDKIRLYVRIDLNDRRYDDEEEPSSYEQWITEWPPDMPFSDRAVPKIVAEWFNSLPYARRHDPLNAKLDYLVPLEWVREVCLEQVLREARADDQEWERVRKWKLEAALTEPEKFSANA